MDELTTVSVGTVEGIVVLLAKSSFVFGRHVLFLLKFVIAMGEGAIVTELALSILLPVLAHLLN
jgi:hypothetical protein